jgi:large subunit ribosomal protein L24
MAGKFRYKMHVRTGDMVHIIAGKERGNVDDKSKRGKVLRVLPLENRVIVERMNFIKRHTRPDRANRQGGIIEREGKIHVSNVMVVCPKCDRPVKIKHTLLEDGSKVRACKRCDEILDQ